MLHFTQHLILRSLIESTSLWHLRLNWHRYHILRTLYYGFDSGNFLEVTGGIDNRENKVTRAEGKGGGREMKLFRAEIRIEKRRLLNPRREDTCSNKTRRSVSLSFSFCFPFSGSLPSFYVRKAPRRTIEALIRRGAWIMRMQPR